MSRIALVVGLLAWGVLAACAASKDGFNLYKDLLRGKIDADEPPEENENSPKLVYFFRTPVSKENEGQAGSPFAPGPEDYLGEPWSKRGPGSVLTWVLSSRQLGVRPDLRQALLVNIAAD
ncbi:uncharacterized protein LOC134534541 [Bacillus rossius redtenbacheri]|uniref:uncharacterized protein LOC134534541 n=1 Tax=Bacillus rossius redtenbacheri TaxID=93214 RepID=UPI002FDDE387